MDHRHAARITCRAWSASPHRMARGCGQFPRPDELEALARTAGAQPFHRRRAAGQSAGKRPDPDLNEAVAGRWVENTADLRTSAAGRIVCLHQPLQAHSATDLRQRIAAGASWRSLVPPAVADYIAEHRLYGYDGTAAVIGMPPF